LLQLGSQSGAKQDRKVCAQGCMQMAQVTSAAVVKAVTTAAAAAAAELLF
jgi:hypothetical protein